MEKSTNKVRSLRHYLDYNATSPLSPSVRDWLKSGDVIFANPASQHSSGKEARKQINQCRAQIYSTFNKTEKEQHLYFHSGATEGIQSIFWSFWEMALKQGRRLLVCYSSLDHPCVTSFEGYTHLSGLDFLKLRRGSNLEYLHSENQALIKEWKEEHPEGIVLYHHLWVHNETGQISPLSELNLFKQFQDLYIHVDAVQSPGKIADWRHLVCGDIWTFSSHKFGALKGVGFSLLNKNFPFSPLFVGGGQQFNLRSGTENLHGVISTGLALSDLNKINIAQNALQKEELAKFLAQEIFGIGELLNKFSLETNSNTIYFYLYSLTSDVALALFDQVGIELSAGSACSSGSAKASTLLMHLGLDKVAKNGLRISLPFQVTNDEIESIKRKFKEAFQKIRSAQF